jgi:hypothetical protein
VSKWAEIDFYRRVQHCGEKFEFKNPAQGTDGEVGGMKQIYK